MSILSKNYLYFEVILSRYTEKQSNYKILKFRVYLKTLKWCVFDIKYFNLTIHFYLGLLLLAKYPIPPLICSESLLAQPPHSIEHARLSLLQPHNMGI